MGEDKLTLTPEIAATLQAHIDALAPTTLGEWPVRVCQEELNALPLHSGNLFVWALRPDGAILVLDLDAVGHRVTPEEDELTRFAVVVHGARTYPVLRALIPRPPSGTAACLECNATGLGPAPAQSCGHCRGLGWVAPAR